MPTTSECMEAKNRQSNVTSCICHAWAWNFTNLISVWVVMWSIYQSDCVLYSSPLETEVECEEEEEEPLPSSCDTRCRLGMEHERNNNTNTCFGTTLWDWKLQTYYWMCSPYLLCTLIVSIPYSMFLKCVHSIPPTNQRGFPPALFNQWFGET